MPRSSEGSLLPWGWKAGSIKSGDRRQPLLDAADLGGGHRWPHVGLWRGRRAAGPRRRRPPGARRRGTRRRRGRAGGAERSRDARRLGRADARPGGTPRCVPAGGARRLCPLLQFRRLSPRVFSPGMTERSHQPLSRRRASAASRGTSIRPVRSPPAPRRRARAIRRPMASPSPMRPPSVREVEPDEPLEKAIAIGFRDAGARVTNRNSQFARAALLRYLGPPRRAACDEPRCRGDSTASVAATARRLKSVYLRGTTRGNETCRSSADDAHCADDFLQQLIEIQILRG